MHKTLSTLQRSFWMVFLALLVACGTMPPALVDSHINRNQHANLNANHPNAKWVRFI